MLGKRCSQFRVTKLSILRNNETMPTLQVQCLVQQLVLVLRLMIFMERFLVPSYKRAQKHNEKYSAYAV
jgi:hypothetical protein